MYQKEAYGAINLDTLINLDDAWCNTSAYFDSADSMAFTPTTLAKFEATFSDFNADLAASEQNCSSLGALTSEAAANQLWGGAAGSSQGEYSDSEDSDGSNSNWSVASKKRKTTKQGEQKVTSWGGEAGEQGEQKPPRKLPGPRPSRPLDQMTPLEQERRQRRRLRNKNAATKCRQRRLEVTNDLLQETETLEKQSSQLEREIESLLRQKDQLQFVLDAHLATCRGIPVPLPESSAVGHMQVGHGQRFTSPVRPNSLHIATTCGASAMPAINSSMFSFDVTTSLTGLTPMLSTGEMSSLSSYLLLSPSMLLAQ
jgi:hypothetical protein